MNERIQELMRQSMVEYQFDMRFSPEKFAELIVRECSHVAKVNQAENMGWDIGEILLEHFGVE